MSNENISIESELENKPVSAYALFFRDTQAAIKGQNPNASFGEVSKIVASMWDALDSDHKNVYKKKTEAAKKEYLKALAAYRASLVSKSAGEPEGGMYGNYGNFNNQYSGYSPQNALPSPPMGGAPTPPAQQAPQPANQMKKPAMMPMNGQQQAPQQPSPQHQGMMGSPMAPMGHMTGHMPPHMQQQGYMQQVNVVPSHMQPPPVVGDEHNMVPSSPPVSAPANQQTQQHAIPSSTGPSTQQQSTLQSTGNASQQQSMGASTTAATTTTQQQQQGGMGQQQQQQQQQQGQQQQQPSPPTAAGSPRAANTCIRHGCSNTAISNSEWQDEYCSNECVVSHCRYSFMDVFSTWVASNQNQSQNFSTVK